MNWWQVIIFLASLCVLGFTLYLVIKNWRISLAVLIVLLSIILRIIVFPIDLIIVIVRAFLPHNTEKLQRRITDIYEQCFFETESLEEVVKKQKKIDLLQKKLSDIHAKQKENQTIKLLNEAKWVI